MKICCPGFFDLIHPGHERFLCNLASEYDDIRVIVLEGGRRPDRLGGVRLTPEKARQQIKRMLAEYPGTAVEIVPIEGVAEWFRANEQVNVVVIGDESGLASYGWLNIVESMLIRRGGGIRIYRESFGGHVLDQRKFGRFPKSHDAEAIYKDLLDSQGTTISSLCSKIEEACGSFRALVVGDLVVDEYIHCSVAGISAEAPIPVMNENRRSVFVGGAGVMARHLAALGCEVTYAASFGLGDVSELVEARLKSDGITCFHLSNSGSPLIKSRYVSGSSKLFRVTRGDAHISFEEDKFEQLLGLLSGYSVLFVADFGSLFRNVSMTSKLLEECKERAIPVVVDVQARGVGASVLSAPGSYVAMPTEKEARLAVDLPDAGLEELGRTLMSYGGFGSLGLTLDEDGVLVFDSEALASVAYLPALNRDPIDVSGAGDCQLVYFAMARLSGSDVISSAVLASVAAGLAVSNLGNLPVTLEDVRECWREGERLGDKP